MSQLIACILRISSALKPLITRIVPIRLLRKVKNKIVAFSSGGIATALPKPFSSKLFPNGVNLIGSIRGESGLGQSSRLVADALNASGLSFTILNYDPLSTLRQTDHSWDTKMSSNALYNINLIHINPHDLAVAYRQLDKAIWDNRYNIGFWLWELEQFPSEWLPTLNLLDEVWTPSDFAGLGLRKVTEKPVYTVPYPISAPIDPSLGRSFFSLPVDQFLFLSMYDCNSFMDRKNPLGAIQSYKKAFPKEQENCGLVIKINHPQKSDLRQLQKELEGYHNIYFIIDALSKVEVNSLIACADVFISLHRSEGFGLPVAEAMLLGTPVIATNWSSTTEFMNEDTACLVGYDFITISKDIGPYKAGNRWAEPHIDEAAKYMNLLYRDRSFAATLAVNAQKSIQKQFSLQSAAEMIRSRVSQIYQAYS